MDRGALDRWISNKEVEGWAVPRLLALGGSPESRIGEDPACHVDLDGADAVDAKGVHHTYSQRGARDAKRREFDARGKAGLDKLAIREMCITVRMSLQLLALECAAVFGEAPHEFAVAGKVDPADADDFPSEGDEPFAKVSRDVTARCNPGLFDCPREVPVGLATGFQYRVRGRGRGVVASLNFLDEETMFLRDHDDRKSVTQPARVARDLRRYATRTQTHVGQSIGGPSLPPNPSEVLIHARQLIFL